MIYCTIYLGVTPPKKMSVCETWGSTWTELQWGWRIKQSECMHLADPAWGRMWWMLFFYGAKPSNFGLPIIILWLSWFHSQSYSAKFADLCRWYGLFVDCYLRTNHCRWNDASCWCSMIIIITIIKLNITIVIYDHHILYIIYCNLLQYHYCTIKVTMKVK